MKSRAAVAFGAGKPLEITVHDHLVVGRSGVASFKSLGLL